jgi:hypothetical protein
MKKVLGVLRTEKHTAILCLAENASIPHEQASPASSTTGSHSSSGSPPLATGCDVTPTDTAGYKAMFNGLAASKLISNVGTGDTKLTLTDEKEYQSESKDVIAQYQLFFACIAKGINPTNGKDIQLMVFTKIFGKFTQFLKTHHSSKAVSILQAHTQTNLENISNSKKLLDGFASLSSTIFNTVFATNLHKFGWTTEILISTRILSSMHWDSTTLCKCKPSPITSPSKLSRVVF